MPSSFSSNTAVLLATAATEGEGLFAALFLRTVGDGWHSLPKRRHLALSSANLPQRYKRREFKGTLIKETQGHTSHMYPRYSKWHTGFYSWRSSDMLFHTTRAPDPRLFSPKVRTPIQPLNRSQTNGREEKTKRNGEAGHCWGDWRINPNRRWQVTVGVLMSPSELKLAGCQLRPTREVTCVQPDPLLSGLMTPFLTDSFSGFCKKS